MGGSHVKAVGQTEVLCHLVSKPKLVGFCLAPGGMPVNHGDLGNIP